tara:strand:+ start:13028 stop:13330 length:303 start_codon:yes stop_codon:yes gene_type:complete
MSKYLSVTLTTTVGETTVVSQRLVRADGVSYCGLGGDSSISIYYYDGGKCRIASAAALDDNDSIAVQSALISAAQSKWSQIVTKCPTLSEPVDSIASVTA